MATSGRSSGDRAAARRRTTGKYRPVVEGHRRRPCLARLLGVGSARGHGVAAHALTAMATWALEELHIPRLQLYVEPWNRASIRTAERAGFVREGLLRSWQKVGERRRDMFMYARLATEAPPRWIGPATVNAQRSLGAHACVPAHRDRAVGGRG
ncbi:GNAT family N-acetyltransferase [Nocardia grenadensis]|uniref:GNAT family N-acetyltransferase n=1 Tax=Nocardia grenadensis TaxID=931537 RepID=UPI0035A2529B